MNSLLQLRRTLGIIVILAIFPVSCWSVPKPLIQIGVEVVEVDTQKTEKLGIQWLNTLHVAENDVPSLLTLGTLVRDRVFADLQALLDEGAADLLANPKLVTREGGTAQFHAGGELPYAVSGSLGTVTVDFKPYGVDLKINPRIDEQNQIALDLDAEVSSPDEQSSVSLAGNVVPGLLSRRVSSQLTLKPGTTLTLAGLIQNQKQWKRTGIPFLSEIPILGYLFSHKVQSNRRTSIVVFVTPTLLTGEEAPGPGRALQPGPTAPPQGIPHVEKDEDEDLLKIDPGV